jgi:signal peptide peptidase SppA
MNPKQIAAFLSGIWLIDEINLEKLAARLALGPRPVKSGSSATGDGVAVIPIHGAIGQRSSIWTEFGFGTSTESIIDRVDAAMADQSIKGIVLDIDSPGGTVPGVQEAADRIFEASHEKPIVAVANSLMASAAYWIGSAAGRVIAAPGSDLGSIGVYMAHVDISQAMADAGVKVSIIKAGKYKAEGNPWEPLPQAAAENWQGEVDSIYHDFLASVAKGRGVSVATVRSDYGQGRTMLAGDAVKAGMADEQGTLASAIGRLAGGKMRGVRRMRMDAGTIRRRAEFARRGILT